MARPRSTTRLPCCDRGREVAPARQIRVSSSALSRVSSLRAVLRLSGEASVHAPHGARPGDGSATGQPFRRPFGLRGGAAFAGGRFADGRLRRLPGRTAVLGDVRQVDASGRSERSGECETLVRMAGSFIAGLELSELFFAEIVRPLLTEALGRQPYSSALMGYGSEVRGSTQNVPPTTPGVLGSPSSSTATRSVGRLPSSTDGWMTSFPTCSAGIPCGSHFPTERLDATGYTPSM